MAGERYYLTEADRNFLNALHRTFGHMLTPASTSKANLPEFPGQSQDVYIALVPEAGIPGVTNNAGDGPPDYAEDDKPGSAILDIYHLVGGELKLIGLQKEVFNLQTGTIEQGWISVKKTKSGHWIADTGGSCADRNETWMIGFKGIPDAGTFAIELEVNSVIEDITIGYDMTASEVKDAFAVHSEIEPADIETEGGPLPYSTVNVRFIGDLAGMPFIPIRIDRTNLSSTEEAVAVEISRWVPGHGGT